MQQYVAFLRHKDERKVDESYSHTPEAMVQNLIDLGQITVDQGIDIFSDEKNKSIIQRKLTLWPAGCSVLQGSMG